MTEILSPTTGGVNRACEILRKKGLLAIPTETVYGLAADARDGEAVAAIYTAKGRPSFNPLIVHVASLDQAQGLAQFSPTALRLARAFWPGPLTLVLPIKKGAGISSLVTAGLDSIAIRVPAHPVALQVLRAFDGPLAAPSANPSGRISPTTAAHVIQGLAGRISAVMDGGACELGVESTIVAVDPDLHLLRPGGLTVEEIEALVGPVSLRLDPAARPLSPGQLESHYAPQARLRLNAVAPHGDEVMIGFGPVTGAFNLSVDGRLEEAAARLFDLLHQADARAGTLGQIAVAPIPDRGLGRAILDRLRRAAAPR